MEDFLTKNTTTITPPSPHVVIFPLPIQGPINCMLKLADLILSLTRAAVSVTFLTTTSVHHRLILHSSTAARLVNSYPNFKLESVSDGVEHDDEDGQGVSKLVELTNSLESQAQDEGSELREVLAYGSAEPELRKAVTCIISDGFYGCMVDVAKELRVPLVYFETISPCGLWAYLCVPNMVRACDLPFQVKQYKELETIAKFNTHQNFLTTMEDHITKIIPTLSPHVVIFPLPIQGPVNSMLKLADLILSLTPAAVSVTFLTTDFIHRRLTLHSNTATRLTHYEPRFRIESVPDGFGSDENPRRVPLLAMSLEGQAQEDGSRLREVLAFGSAEADRKKPVTCVIADGLYGCMVDVAKELKVPLVYFDTISPCCLWTLFCIPNMLKSVDLPFQGEDDLDAAITSVPGMETYLRRRDLPSFCHAYDPNNPVMQLVLKEVQNFSKAQGHILNTFDKLEGDYFSHIQALCPNLYNIGPLHLNLKYRTQDETTTTTTKSISNSLWQEDRSCLAWLDAQPPNSVLFVSIGSLASMTKDQFMEIWYGLVNSKTRFLWVRRPDSIIDLNNKDDTSLDLNIPEELVEGTKARGCIVSWAPQEEVLAHGATGGFLTHCGWNSTLESIVAGVPMICWPFYVDQQVNSRVISEVWKIGLDMNKDNCNRILVEKLINELMVTRRDELSNRVNELAKLATQAVVEDGSSYNSLNRLIDDIVFMRFPILYG